MFVFILINPFNIQSKGINRVYPTYSPQRWKNIKPTYDLFDRLRFDTESYKKIQKRCKSLSDIERV